MDAQPAGPEAQGVGGQENVFHSGAQILEQKRELLVVGLVEVAADHQRSDRTAQHLAVGQEHRQLIQGGAVAEDNKMPGVFGPRRGGRHGRLQQIGQQDFGDLALGEFSNAAP